MKYKEDTRVVTADGADLGDIKRLVIDPATKQVTHLVISEGRLADDEKVIPTTLIASEEDNKIRLRELGIDVTDLPDFRDTDYVMVNEDDFLAMEHVDSTPVPSYYFYPSYPALGGRNYSGELGATSSFENYPPETYTRAEKQNIPESSVALQEGARIYSEDDEHVGDLDQVLTPEKVGRFTHIVISRGLLFKERKLIPAEWIKEITQKAIYLNVDSRTIKKLPEYK